MGGVVFKCIISQIFPLHNFMKEMLSINWVIVFLYLFTFRSVEPIDIVVRPKGQGLGADKRPVMPKKQVRRKPGDKKVEEEEPVGIGKGACILVTSGPHKNLYGKVSKNTGYKGEDKQGTGDLGSGHWCEVSFGSGVKTFS